MPHGRNRGSRKIGNWKKYTKSRKAAFERDNYTCQKCGQLCDGPIDGKSSHKNVNTPSLDHIVPISQGGDVYDIDNMQTLCWPCHKRKTLEEQPDDPTPVSCIICKKEILGRRGFKTHMAKKHHIRVSRKGVDHKSRNPSTFNDRNNE